MAEQNILQVDKIIVTRQNLEASEPAPPSKLEYGELAIDQAGKLYTADKDNNVVVAGGGESQDWSEIDNQTAAEPPNPRQADQLQGYDVDGIIQKAVEATTLVDDLASPEPESLKNADTLNGFSSNNFATAIQGKKADTAVQTINGSTGPNAIVTTQTLVYQVGNTITTTDASFNPNSAIGGTWVQQILHSKDTPLTSVPLLNGATGTCNYIVRNGLCSVFFNDFRWTSVGDIVAAGLPPTAITTAITDYGGLRISIEYNAECIRGYHPLASSAYYNLVYPVLDTFSTPLYVWTKTA